MTHNLELIRNYRSFLKGEEYLFEWYDLSELRYAVRVNVAIAETNDSLSVNYEMPVQSFREKRDMS